MKDVRLGLWKRRLLKAIGLALSEVGFESKARDQSFYCQKPFGRWAVHVGLIDHEADVDITVDVAIRFDEVEHIAVSDSPLLNAKDRAATFTLGVELGNLVDGRQRRWTLRSAANVADVAQDIVKIIRDFGLPYLERFSDLETALALLSGSGREAWLHSPFHEPRYRRAIALALLLGKEERAKEIAIEGETFLRSRADPSLPALKHFVSRVLPT